MDDNKKDRDNQVQSDAFIDAEPALEQKDEARRGVLAADPEAVTKRNERIALKQADDYSAAKSKSRSSSKAAVQADWMADDWEEGALYSGGNPLQKFFRWVLLSPTRLIILSFALLILVVTFLLNLPIATEAGESIGFFKALFTATSMSCVTGLLVVDTATTWSSFGEIVIITAVQVGGLGLVTIMSFFMMAAKRKVSLKTMLAMQESTASDSFVDARSLVQRIIAITLAFELAGGLILAARFAKHMNWMEALRHGIWLSISAFTNAGVDLMGDYSGPFTSLYAWQNDPIILLTIAFLVIFGGLGFVVWNDLIIRVRKRNHLRYHSQLMLKLSAILLLVSTALIAYIEWNNKAPQSMGQLSWGDKLLQAFFQAATLRTAGLTTLDQVHLTAATKFLSVVLMFIGAGPASTGGGVKISTLAVVVATAISNVRGEEETILFKHRIERSNYLRALVIVMLGISVLVSGSFLLAVFEDHRILAGDFNFIDLMYEVISAFSTAGMSTTPTQSLTTASHIVLIVCMYLGRVGPASFAMGLTFRERGSAEMIVPEGRTFVG